ncbi:hypothetical protein JAAARDRAFT_33274 [Jaapia argillacea MUCL 33604]|uniref:Uncharacterized protein n=1 Tax=Jaapia argillacea MUCL 33604 TaxID=933084 RepID=A0A067Q872_9AGAM|nr:hypothetical protein JAAARDRAFT_33274 [Jaapia argillacea MUCL 33604]
MSIRSQRSTKSNSGVEYVAAGKFAKSSLFQPWTDRANIRWQTRLSEKFQTTYTSLSSFKLPKAILSQSTDILNGQEEFRARLSEWAIANPECVCDDDPHGLSSVWLLLCSAYARIRDSAENDAKEGTQRRGVDDLIELALSSRSGCRFQTQFERDISLCEVNGLPTLPKPLARADTLVTTSPSTHLTLRSTLLDLFSSHAIPETSRRHMYWPSSASASNDDFGSLTFILFAGEFKRESGARNKNQLVMDLCTAQYHRRALRLDQIVFGATHSAKRWRVYGSWWVWGNGDDVCDKLHMTEVCSMDLTIPIEFIKCYSFLCALGIHLEEMDEQIAKLDPDKVMKTIVKKPWRARAPAPTPNSDPTPSPSLVPTPSRGSSSKPASIGGYTRDTSPAASSSRFTLDDMDIPDVPYDAFRSTRALLGMSSSRARSFSAPSIPPNSQTQTQSQDVDASTCAGWDDVSDTDSEITSAIAESISDSLPPESLCESDIASIMVSRKRNREGDGERELASASISNKKTRRTLASRVGGRMDAEGVVAGLMSPMTRMRRKGKGS